MPRGIRGSEVPTTRSLDMTTQLAAPEKALTIVGEGYTLTVTPEAIALKEQLLAAAMAITVVTSNEEAETAHAQVKELAKLRTLTEKSRVEVKAPVLAITKRIDDTAKAFGGDVEREENRLKRLIGDHAAKVEEERRAAIRRQQEEERKREEEEAKAKAAAEEAERARKAAEAAEWEDDEETKAVEEAKAKAAAELAEATRKASEEAGAAARTASLVVNTAPTGKVKFEPDYTVTDVHALYAAHPDLVELTVKRSPTIARIRAHMELHGDELPSFPGLSITKQAKVGTR